MLPARKKILHEQKLDQAIGRLKNVLNLSSKTFAVIIAPGGEVNPLIVKTVSGLQTDNHGHIELANPDINLTSRPSVFE